MSYSDQKPRGCLVVFAVSILLSVGFLFRGIYRDRHLDDNYDRVRSGMSVQAVKQILGEPSYDGRCGGYGFEVLVSGCASEFVYPSAFAPLLPSYFVVQMGDDQRVVDAYFYDSP